MKQDKTELFETLPIPKAVTKLAVPSVLSCIVMILYNTADTYFVGLLGDAVQSASVTLAASVTLSFNAVSNLFGVGGASCMSRALGRREPETAKQCSAFCFWSTVAFAILISICAFLFEDPLLRLIGADETTAAATAEYMLWTVKLGALPAILNVVLSNLVRSEGSSMQAGIGVMSGCILNIILDPFFVLPQFLGMGASGAGLATLISNIFACLYFAFYMIRNRRTTIVCVDPSRFAFGNGVGRDVFGVGVPASIQNLLNVVGSVILNNYTAVYGAAAVSAMGISHKIAMFGLYISQGITQGVMPLISYNYSSGNGRRMKDTIIYVAKISLSIGLIMTSLTFVFSHGLVSLFMKNEEVVMIGTPLLRAQALGTFFLAVDFLAVAVFQAIGKGQYSLLFAILRKVVLQIPAIILFDRIKPLYGMGWAPTAAEFVLAFAAVFMVAKIFRDVPDRA